MMEDIEFFFNKYFKEYILKDEWVEWNNIIKVLNVIDNDCIVIV